MTESRYFRPASVSEALVLLKEGVPLAGGTELLRGTRKAMTYIDLQGLGLDELESSGEAISIGAMVRLQDLVEAADDLPAALVQACIDERGWNLRNMRTIGGSTAAADGRSQVMTVLLSMKPDVVLAPNDETIPLVDLISARHEALKGKLILRLNAVRPKAAAYAQVARTPKDLPVVCAAVSRFQDKSYGIALGGYGEHPIRVPAAEKALADGADITTVREAVVEAYQAADDRWASGEYRGEVAGVLVSRLVKEVG